MNNLSLDSVEWKEFIIGDIFEIKKVYGRPIENYKDGSMPFISTTNLNNGVVNFITADEKVISMKNCISVDPINGKCFYHGYDFVGRGYSGASVNILYNENLNKYISLFICQMIEKTSNGKASYGNLFNSNRLKFGKILLPIDEKGEPNWVFMENYIKQVMNRQKSQIISYYKSQLSDIAYGGGIYKIAI